MDKEQFLEEAKCDLKRLGFRKNRNYWYLEKNNLIFCVYVQGSQWDKNDYYVEMGIACSNASHGKNPTILNWFCRHRCTGTRGDKNICPSEMLSYVQEMIECVSGHQDLQSYMASKKAVKVVNQYWF